MRKPKPIATAAAASWTGELGERAQAVAVVHHAEREQQRAADQIGLEVPLRSAAGPSTTIADARGRRRGRAPPPGRRAAGCPGARFTLRSLGRSTAPSARAMRVTTGVEQRGDADGDDQRSRARAGTSGVGSAPSWLSPSSRSARASLSASFRTTPSTPAPVEHVEGRLHVLLGRHVGAHHEQDAVARARSRPWRRAAPSVGGSVEDHPVEAARPASPPARACAPTRAARTGSAAARGRAAPGASMPSTVDQRVLELARRRAAPRRGPPRRAARATRAPSAGADRSRPAAPGGRRSSTSRARGSPRPWSCRRPASALVTAIVRSGRSARERVDARAQRAELLGDERLRAGAARCAAC